MDRRGHGSVEVAATLCRHWLSVPGRAPLYAPALAHVFPRPGRISPAAAGLPHAEAVEIATSDGERVIAWHLPPRSDQPVVLYFHGNGGNLAGRAERFRRLISGGAGLLALSYRGYGGSSGSPSEAGLLRDGAAAYEFAAARYPASRIALWGESLGTAVAVAIAAERPVAGLALDSPFTSTVDIAPRSTGSCRCACCSGIPFARTSA